MRQGLQELRSGSIYYRRHLIEALQHLYARNVLAAHAADSVESFVGNLGFDAEAALADYARWREVLSHTHEIGVMWQGWATGIDHEAGIALYGVCRALRPRTVIETGVASGVTSAFIGAALVDNGSGQLISLELPADEAAELYDRYMGQPYDYGISAGWAVPDMIRQGLGDRHQLILEDVRSALPRLLPNTSDLDLFVHDDLHTVGHMTWELNLVWPHLAPGGVLVADDAGYAWVRFARRLGHSKALTTLAGTGAARKP